MLIALVLITFRDRYVQVGQDVYRIDALTGSFCRYPCETFPPQVLPSVGPTPTPYNREADIAQLPIGEQLAYARGDRFRKLQAAAGPFDMANFGQQMETVALHLDDVIKQAFESSDGMLYVVYSHCTSIGAGCERYHMGFIAGDSLTEVWLPHGPLPWLYMELLSSSTPDTAVVRASDQDGKIHQFAVSSRGIVHIPITRDGSLDVRLPHALDSGESCRLEPRSGSSTMIWAIDAKGHQRELVSKRDFRNATENLIELTDVAEAWCTHFYDVNMLVAGDQYQQDVTFMLTPGRIRLAASNAPSFMTRHSMMFAETKTDKDGGVVGWDYCIARPKRKL
ncbi:MAG: hypothetical protein M3Z41_04025 [Candidatus Eremiobacteraeota bacterium]|nr:hypothetical protein [Candidatus Eremiobacteraeota bacterium]